jgi:hypothetical protein
MRVRLLLLKDVYACVYARREHKQDPSLLDVSRDQLVEAFGFSTALGRYSWKAECLDGKSKMGKVEVVGVLADGYMNNWIGSK